MPCSPRGAKRIACAYEDGNDANTLRTDPVFKLGLERKPLETDTDFRVRRPSPAWRMPRRRKDLYRMAHAFVDQFIDSYAKPPALIVLDLDHSEDAAHGQQEQIFYNAHYRSHGYLPLFLFGGISGKFITAVPLAPANVPPGRRTP